MVREIVKDEAILSQVCVAVERGEDVSQIVQDLIDTAEAHSDVCIGLAANQIGYNKRIILVRNGKSWTHLINPVIMGDKLGGKIQSEERCLSLEGERIASRYNKVTLMFVGAKGKVQKAKYGKPFSIVLQHETDHLNGILI